MRNNRSKEILVMKEFEEKMKGKKIILPYNNIIYDVLSERSRQIKEEVIDEDVLWPL